MGDFAGNGRVGAAVEERHERSTRNPRGDWRIQDVEALGREYGVICEPARGGGSHYKVAHPQMIEKLTIPYKRPIKPVYIRKLAAFIDALRSKQ
jgi:hypothetical protein